MSLPPTTIEEAMAFSQALAEGAVSLEEPELAHAFAMIQILAERLSMAATTIMEVCDLNDDLARILRDNLGLEVEPVERLQVFPDTVEWRGKSSDYFENMEAINAHITREFFTPIDLESSTETKVETPAIESTATE